MSNDKSFTNKIETSAVLTVIGVILLFSGSIIVTLIAPSLVDPSWTSPTSPYQVQMYEVADPNIYIGSSPSGERQVVRHVKAGYTLLAFQESDLMRIIASPELEKYITRIDQTELKLTPRLLLLRKPVAGLQEAAAIRRKDLLGNWHQAHPDAEKEGTPRPDYTFLELYAPPGNSAFVISASDSILEDWVDENYTLMDGNPQESYHRDPGVIYVRNPQEYRIKKIITPGGESWLYHPEGAPIADMAELKGKPFGFLSREELIKTGEHIYAIEGCWYCHTDQTRTLVQDVVLNGSESYPAPPSSANEYIYQSISFAGTRRIGPDLSRVGVKRPGRDWHKGHFWSPKTASAGSIMPAFQHFFDNDPRGTGGKSVNLPNYRFEAVYQYLMTKGTRITPPTQAWWLGKDPVQTKEIIEGMRTLKP